MKIARILDSGRKRHAAELTPDLPVAYGHSRDWAGCTIVTIGLPDLISTSHCEKVGRIPRLARSSMTTSIVRNAPITVISQKDHLVFSRVRAEWPTMTKDNEIG